jgi:uncharacterized protein (DUF427 family)
MDTRSMAMTKTLRAPGPDHPITIRPAGRRVVVRTGDVVLADTQAALELKEAQYPAVFYVPRADAKMDQLARTTHETYCPYKGGCNYFSIPALGTRGENAVWTYESPHDAVKEIADHLAFYPDRVSITAE